MDKEIFEKKLLEETKKYLCDFDVNIVEYCKVNRTVKALEIQSDKSAILPVFDLNDAYERFCLADSFNEFFNNFKKIIEHSFNQRPDLNMEKFFDKSNIICQLVNIKMNRELLEDVPHVKYMDLALIYRAVADMSDINGITASCIITNENMKKLNLNENELYENAISNSKEKTAAVIVTMRTMLEEIMDTVIDAPIPGEKELYVMTNSNRTYGAAAMIYDAGKIQELADSLEKNLYIIPSSIHEVLLVPDDGQKPEELNCMINEVNSTVLDKGDILSDHAYFYDRKKMELSKAINENPNLKRNRRKSK